MKSSSVPNRLSRVAVLLVAAVAIGSVAGIRPGPAGPRRCGRRRESRRRRRPLESRRLRGQGAPGRLAGRAARDSGRSPEAGRLAIRFAAAARRGNCRANQARQADARCGPLPGRLAASSLCARLSRTTRHRARRAGRRLAGRCGRKHRRRQQSPPCADARRPDGRAPRGRVVELNRHQLLDRSDARRFAAVAADRRRRLRPTRSASRRATR